MEINVNGYLIRFKYESKYTRTSSYYTEHCSDTVGETLLVHAQDWDEAVDLIRDNERYPDARNFVNKTLGEKNYENQ